MLNCRLLNCAVNSSNCLKKIWVSVPNKITRVAGICSGRQAIGNRDIVGYGLNGVNMYSDQTDCPFPAIRFRETTPELLVNFMYLKF